MDRIVTSNQPLWKIEFGASYDVPDVIANDPRLHDISWHNDTAPSFTDARGDQQAELPRLWCEHPDPTRREFYGEEIANVRYIVAPGSEEDWSGAKGNYYEGDDPVAAVAALLAVYDRGDSPEETRYRP